MDSELHPQEKHHDEDGFARQPPSPDATSAPDNHPQAAAPAPEKTTEDQATPPLSATAITEPQPEPPPMEVHHHTHTPRQKWTHYFWEFTMLFLAVTAGFMAENLREHYVEQHRVKEYANSLVHDLQSDTIMVNRIIGEMQGFNQRVDSLASFMTTRNLPSLTNLDLYFFANRLQRVRPYTWRRTTIDQIKGSGSLRYFRNDSLVNKIASYDAFTRHMDEDYHLDMAIITKASEHANTIIDFNYPAGFQGVLYREKDSVVIMPNYNVPPERTLLTKDARELKVFLNSYLKARFMLNIRITSELPRLKRDATRLIKLLQEEYHL